ncbi:Uu.00g019020.m01.CDS01 [Anthostomella pinea]|uniref:Uu.00g019020.m01.CDS01 n=1 Tax=Anthostomella pinea TaxID=933095 RepID=A0AAI8W0E6_9PEZI|nr:Uu.00g019020.m01.CDS01 [Anthostomella pinea]
MASTEMASMGEPNQSQPQRSSSPDGGDDANSAAKKAIIRKRTKTGCTTCRKRRIKCDEGRPTCNNCLKSKRQCEGYNQRVIFKDPLGFAGSPYGPIHYPAPSPQALLREQQLAAAQQRASSQALQIIAPKPPILGYPLMLGTQFDQFYPGQAGPVGASSTLTFEEAQFGVPPQPSRFTFFPPTTVDAFSQGQWRQESSEDLHQSSPPTGQKNTQDVGTLVPPNPSDAQPGKGKAVVVVEPLTNAVEPQLEDWEYPDFDDDASMADSDDEPTLIRRDSQLSLNELGLVMSQRIDLPYHMHGTHTRTFSAFHEDVLASYDPSPANSPLNDKQIAAVFWHFVNVTGPSVSLYERHPLDPTHIFHGQPIPKSRQHIWTYAFPILSFGHPALLQAILALGSLQIAKLQRVPPTASLKHYHLALRRIAKNVSRPARRAQASNLAATLLLGFYEVWNSDHDKWSRHLLGARWIIKEIPYARMTRSMMAVKLQQRQREMAQAQMDGFGYFNPLEEPGPLHKDWDAIDVPLLCAITGRNISYDDYGMLPEDMSSHPRPKHAATHRDMERYEQLSDLFWWYCKMDVYQSILGGTRPFMEYDAWTQCPPRAPMGRLDAIYGTYDHLMLLLGRLMTFASRDIVRKREAIKVKGAGPGKPPPGMFVGMMPASENVTLPMGFSPPREESPPSDVPPKPDLDTRTAEACREWERIRQAFDELKNHFGPEFEPLAADIHPAEATPFGLAAHYRTYPIAGIWMNFYMGLIVLHRAHPMMPPVAMLAAGMSAQATMPYALAIGRIAAGLEANISHLQVVSTLTAAALIECSFPLFVAGIQFRDTQQRHWLVRRLHDIARLTGWQSAHQIADGCESAWTKAAQYGRGPPYERAADVDDDYTLANYAHVQARAREAADARRPSTMAPPLSTRGGISVGRGGSGGNPRRIDRRIHEVDNDDGGKIVLAKGEKAFYAMGLLAVEHDLEKLDLDAADRER